MCSVSGTTCGQARRVRFCHVLPIGGRSKVALVVDPSNSIGAELSPQYAGALKENTTHLPQHGIVSKAYGVGDAIWGTFSTLPHTTTQGNRVQVVRQDVDPRRLTLTLYVDKRFTKTLQPGILGRHAPQDKR